MNDTHSSPAVDAVVVGAGFAGLYMIHRLKELGLTVQAFERGGDVGGTWYWNRYPGARCDVESRFYCYSFSSELLNEWSWSERYPLGPELLDYARYVADRFDLRRHICFATSATTARFDDEARTWDVHTDRGHVTCRFLIAAVGCLSASQIPSIPGLESFEGDTVHTGQWPHEGYDFTGQSVAVIGTGSSGIQVVPEIARQAAWLTVFQRTANYCVPAHNHPIDDSAPAARDQRARVRRDARLTRVGAVIPFNDQPAREVADPELWEQLESRWQVGGASMFLSSFSDITIDPDSNERVSEFVRHKIKGIVRDPMLSELLSPVGHPIGAKRVCVSDDYFSTYNHDHVELVDLRASPIARLAPTGIETADGRLHEFDTIVFATGYDAITGSLLRMDVRGAGGITLAEKWREGPRAYLGVATSGFPNLFMITGPGSPSVLGNVIVSIEQHVEWISDLLAWMQAGDVTEIEAESTAEEGWAAHVNELASATLHPTAASWYLGANTPGKPRVFMPYLGGCDVYRAVCDDVADAGYKGFVATRR